MSTMLENVTVNSRSSQITTPNDREIVVTRMFDAPRSVVFEAWTKVEHVARWWDPSGVPLVVCEIDLRTNGTYRWVNHGADGAHHAFTGTYREITAPERLVFTVFTAPSSPESLATLIFSDVAEKTKLTITMEFASKEQRDFMIETGVAAGTAQTLENLAEHLRTIAESA